MSIKHDHTLHPVTALGFYSGPGGSQLILAGEGCFLKVFEAESSKLICSIKVFSDQTIHGILIREDGERGDALQVAIWGGCLLTLLEKDAFDAHLRSNASNAEDYARTVSDWILDVAISPYDDSCVLVTAHNSVLRTWLRKYNVSRFDELSSPSRSILYSAHLIWESSTCVLVAAGTVFGEIIAWECSVSDETPAAGCRVHATLTGHEGSIFGVNISPPIYGLYERPVRLLASCSDDRTIRIWDIQRTPVESGKGDPDVSGVSSLRETGFGDNGVKLNSPNSPNRCLAMVMGHVSRIWRVKFRVSNLDNSKSSIDVFSFGEDSTAQQWALEFNSTSIVEPGSSELSAGYGPNNPGNLSHVTTFAFHSGKHIWSAAMCEAKHMKTILVTGGADGKISLYYIPLIAARDDSELSSPPQDMHEHVVQDHYRSVETFSHLTSLSLEDVLDSFGSGHLEKTEIAQILPSQVLDEEPSLLRADGKPAKKKKPPKAVPDAFNRYTFVTDSSMLATTNFGRVLLGHITSSIKWEELHLPGEGKDDLKSYSIVKGVTQLGLAFLAGTNGNIYIYQVGSSITNVASVGKKVADIFPLFNVLSRKVDLAVATLGGNTIEIFGINPDSKLPVVTNAVSYDLPEKFVVTSVGKINDVLVFGSRNGSLAIYHEGNSLPATKWKPNESNYSGDAITSIVPVPSSTSEGHYFLTTGRNGQYAIYSFGSSLVEGKMVKCTVRQVHTGTPPLGPNIEEALFDGPNLILYGFKSKRFMIWNETKQQEIMITECGGAHRSYAYSRPQTNSGGHFIYTKASKLYVHSWQYPSHRIIKPGGHGREIKACATSPDQNFIATGAEDTALRVWRYSDTRSIIENHFECLAVIQKHTSGIQHVQWCGSNYLFSSAGNEEFFIWAVEYIPGFGIGVVCEASSPDPSAERDLRIMSFDVTEEKQARAKNETCFLISMAYSDSTIRTYRYRKSSGYELVANGRYTSSCLMQLRHIYDTRHELHLLTAATDGNLVLWKSPEGSNGISRLSTHNLHQSSVKCLDITISNFTKRCIVATGGDDNSLAITIYDLRDLNLTPRSIIVRSAHAAAVTGLCLIPRSFASEKGDEELRVASSSNDQRVKEWSLTMGRDREAMIRMVGDAFTSVADAGDVAVLRDGQGGKGPKVLVVGNGMEAYKVCCE